MRLSFKAIHPEMIENGYIQYLTAELVIDEDGNPVSGGGQWSDYIPACIEGNRNTDSYKTESGIRFEKPTYTVYIRRQDISQRVRLFDKNKALLGDFSVRTEQVSPIVNQTRITV